MVSLYTRNCRSALVPSFKILRMEFAAELLDVLADPRAHLHDGLVALRLDLLAHAGRSGSDQFTDVGPKLAGGRINNLEFFFDADGESVRHSGPCPSGTEVLGWRVAGIIL